MKFIYLLSFVLTLTVAKAYDEGNFDIAGALNDVAKLKILVGCLLDSAPCDGIPPNFKQDLPEVFQTACAKCPAQQKTLLRGFFDTLQTKLPSEFEAFTKKYDPEGKYSPALFVAIAPQLS